jgi:hypothetical protein
MSRLLLVEFAVEHRFHRGGVFPFLFGYAKRCGAGARWLRFGVPPSARDAGGAKLSGDDLELLGRHAAELEPTVVIFSHRPLRELSEAVGSAARRYYCESSSGGPSASDASEAIQFLDLTRTFADELLAREDPSVHGSGLFREVTPDYGWSAGNQLARRIDPLPSVYAGEECTFNLPFSRNDFYAAADLSRCFRKGGCGFCGRLPNAGQWQTDPLSLLERQLLAIERTCPRPSGRLCVRLVGEPAMARIDEMARLIVRLGVSPMDFLLDSRTDTLVESRGRLERALQALSGSGHRLQVALVGIESFSSTELERLNKGLAPATNVRAVQCLFELEAAFEGCFSFREHPGLSVITFTPWATPWELDLTTALVEQLGIGDAVGKLLTGRLRLYPGLPLEAVARDGGLVVDDYGDRLLDTSEQNFYDREIPWRFLHPEMEAVNQVLSRWAEHAGGQEDALVKQLRQQLGPREVAPTPGELARACVRIAMRQAWEGRAVTPGDLCAGLPEALAEQTSDGEGSCELPTELVPLEAWLDEKPVIKLEPVAPEQVERWLSDERLPNAAARHRSAGGSAELFFGRDARDVELALEQSELAETPRDQRSFTGAVLELGRLLGYPTCCSRAFASEAPAIIGHWFWTHVARRLESEGRVPFELNPACGISEHVPCTASCEPSLERARRLIARIADPGQRAALIERAQHPQLLLLGAQGTSLELIPQTDPGARFRYRAGVARGVGPDLRAAAEGDELVLERECVLVLRAGRPLASLSGRAFLWWHAGVHQAELWGALVAFRRAVPQPSRRTSIEPTKASGLMRAFEQIVAALRRADARFAGHRLASSRRLREGILVSLKAGSSELELFVEERAAGKQALSVVGPFAISHPHTSPLDTPEKLRAAHAFAAQLDHLLERRRRARA